MSDISSMRLRLLSNGYIPLPITSPDAGGKSPGKRPALRRWQTIDVSADLVRDWERTRGRETNTGMRCGHLLGMDLDVRNQVLVNEVVVLLNNTIGPSRLRRIGLPPK